MAAIRRCDDHGHFDTDTDSGDCPTCGAAGRAFLSAERRTRLSKFISGALRHFPGDAGLALDEAGWTPYGDLVEAAARNYAWVAPEHVAAVVATDPKGRFERRQTGGDARIRAAYGHSVEVNLDAESATGVAAGEGEPPIPDTLYHGTDPANLDSIRREGLKPMGRREVHLSESVSDAREVGRRHAADPVVLAVDAATMRADDRRVTKRGRATYTADRVPPAYLSREEGGR